MLCVALLVALVVETFTTTDAHVWALSCMDSLMNLEETKTNINVKGYSYVILFQVK